MIYVLLALMSNTPRQATFTQEFNTLDECQKASKIVEKLSEKHNLFYYHSVCIEKKVKETK